MRVLARAEGATALVLEGGHTHEVKEKSVPFGDHNRFSGSPHAMQTPELIRSRHDKEGGGPTLYEGSFLMFFLTLSLR